MRPRLPGRLSSWSIHRVTRLRAHVTYNATTTTATLTPTAGLASSTTYTATVKGGSNGVKSSSGDPLASDFSWSFTTVAPVVNNGPGGPILVITSSANPFSRYYGEILSAEGFNEYLLADISTVTSTTLANYDVAILGDMSLTSAQVSMLTTWVNGGGELIAMHPDKQLAGLLGLTSSTSVLSNSYLVVQTSTGPGVGIVGQSIQFHGPADQYTLNGASSFATLYSNASTSTNSPAVTLVHSGSRPGCGIYLRSGALDYLYPARQSSLVGAGARRTGRSDPLR